MTSSGDGRALTAILVLVVVLLVAPLAEPVRAQGASAMLGPLIGQTVWLDGTTPLVIELAAPGAATLIDPTVIVRFGEALDRDELDATRGSTDIDRPSTRTFTDPVLAGDVLRVELAPTGSTGGGPQIPRLTPGVHPVVVDLRDGGASVDDFRTDIVVLPEDPSPGSALSLAVLLERTPPPMLQPDGTVTLRTGDVAWTEALAALLARVPDGDPRFATTNLLVSPAMVRDLAESGDAEAVAAVAALAAALPGHQLLAAPVVPVDEALLAAAGRLDLLTELRDRGTVALASALAPAVTSDTVAGLDTVAWDDTVAVLDTAAGDDTVAALAELGVGDLLVPAEAVRGDVDAADRHPLGAARSGSSAFVVDDRVTGLLDGPDAELAAVAAAVDLAALWFDDPDRSRGLVLRPSDAAVLAPTALGRLLDLVAASPLLDVVSLPELFDRVPATGSDLTLVDEPSVPLGQLLDERAALARRVRSFESMLGGAQPLSTSLVDRLDTALADGLTSATRSAYLAAVDQVLSRSTDGIRVPDGQAFTLTSRSAVVRLEVDNDLGFDAHVLVRLESDTRLELTAGNDRSVVLTPGQNLLDVPVRTRSTGSTRIAVQVFSPDGQLLLAEGDVGVRSTALTGVAVVLGGGAILVLAVWWARQILRHRRADA